MGEYKIGDWIKDTHNGDVYEIISKKADVFIDWYDIVKKIDGQNNSLIKIQFKSSINTNSLQSYFIPASVAQVLYSSNSNKAVTNETNEE